MGPFSNKKPASRKTAPGLPSLQADLIFALVKDAGIYLVCFATYLTIATIFVAKWKKFISPNGERVDVTTWRLAAVLSVPILLALLFNVLPAWRRHQALKLRPTGVVKPRYFSSFPRDVRRI